MVEKHYGHLAPSQVADMIREKTAELRGKASRKCETDSIPKVAFISKPV
jgi:hypothetical protein